MEVKSNFVKEHIRKLREEKGWTQEQLSKKSNVSRITIGNYERGNRTPNIDQLSKIAQALEVPLNYFIDDWQQRDFTTMDSGDALGEGLLSYLHHINCDNYPEEKDGEKGLRIILKKESKTIFINFESFEKLEILAEFDIKKWLLILGQALS